MQGFRQQKIMLVMINHMFLLQITAGDLSRAVILNCVKK